MEAKKKKITQPKQKELLKIYLCSRQSSIHTKLMNIHLNADILHDQKCKMDRKTKHTQWNAGETWTKTSQIQMINFGVETVCREWKRVESISDILPALCDLEWQNACE